MRERKPGSGSKDFFSANVPGVGGLTDQTQMGGLTQNPNHRADAADAARAAKLAGHQSFFGRWRSWRKRRHDDRPEANARSHETLKNYKQSGRSSGGPLA